MNQKTIIFRIFMLVLFVFAALVHDAAAAKGKQQVRKEAFGKTGDGRPVALYTLTNSKGMEVRAMTYGGIIVSIRVPDKNGKIGDVVLGHDNVDGYLVNPPYFGAIVGRYANRIAGGTFTLDGVKYTLPKNDGPNTLHGGLVGFNKVIWEAKEFKNAKGVGVAFSYVSKDGEEGFPGNLKVKVTYSADRRKPVDGGL